jgi:P27 family predicted phage terminase small subunit
MLEARGLMGQDYGAALIGYCVAVDVVRASSETIAAEGRYTRSEVVETVTKPDGTVVERASYGAWRSHPAVVIQKNALLVMHKFLSEFGLSPASRARVTAIHAENEQERAEAERAAAVIGI